MATTAPAQTQLGGQQYGQSAWHHVSETVGNMGQQHAGANGAIATRMTGGRRRQSKSRKVDRRQSKSRKVDRRQSKSRRQGQRRQRQSRRQRGGRR